MHHDTTATIREKIDVPSQVCEFLVDALQRHCEMWDVVLLSFLLDADLCCENGYLYLRSVWNAGELNGDGSGESADKIG